MEEWVVRSACGQRERGGCVWKRALFSLWRRKKTLSLQWRVGLRELEGERRWLWGRWLRLRWWWLWRERERLRERERERDWLRLRERERLRERLRRGREREWWPRSPSDASLSPERGGLALRS